MAQVAATQKLTKKWDNKYTGMPVKMFLVYGREAHLEWQAKNTQERHDRAAYSQELSQIVTGEDQIITTLVDEVLPGKPGSSPVADSYAGPPNGVTIIDQEGKVIFFAFWYRFGEVDEFLTELGKKQGWLKGM